MQCSCIEVCPLDVVTSLLLNGISRFNWKWTKLFLERISGSRFHLANSKEEFFGLNRWTRDQLKSQTKHLTRSWSPPQTDLEKNSIHDPLHSQPYYPVPLTLLPPNPKSQNGNDRRKIFQIQVQSSCWWERESYALWNLKSWVSNYEHKHCIISSDDSWLSGWDVWR